LAVAAALLLPYLPPPHFLASWPFALLAVYVVFVAPRIVEWFRIDPWPRIRLVLLTGPSILTVGGLVIAISFVSRAPPTARTWAAATGFVLIATGALSTMLRMQHLLRDEVLLALRTDGLMVQASPDETFVPWDELEGARWDAARGALVVSRAGGIEVAVARAFAGIAGDALAAKIMMTKRKAAMNLLR
jgi:hypothetical protein